MFSKWFYLAILIVIFFMLQGASFFFVKHVKTGMCINVTEKVEGKHSWGNLSYVGLSNKCLDPGVQCRFLDNSAMKDLRRKVCFEGTLRIHKKGFDVPMLYLLRAKNPAENCRDKEHAVSQTSWGGLSIYYPPDRVAQCAVPKENSKLKERGIDSYIELQNCKRSEDKRFNFGAVTCHGNMIKNANCPTNQYMVIATAFYRGLSSTKTCGLSDDHNCEVDVTYLLKKHCNCEHECTITVNDTLFPVNLCTGFTKYLYFEYQCNDTAKFFNNICVPEGPPLNVTVTAESSSILSVTWELPEKDKRNGRIVNYIACVSHEENKTCFLEYTTNEKKTLISNLKASTKYYVRVLANTKFGRGPFSESKGGFTNGKQPKTSATRTAYTLNFFLQIPPQKFTYFYVVVLKLKDGKKSRSPDSYENNELVAYDKAKESSDPKPYIAALLTSKDVISFKLGDGTNTSNPTSRRRRSISIVYYNGPLEPSTKYSIFQRIFINNEGDYYSTDWSPPLKTSDYSGGPRVLANISSSYIKAKQGDLVNLLCSAQGEPPIAISWEKEKKQLESFGEIEKSHRSSFLVVTVKNETNFGDYICHIRDRFQSITHTILVQKSTEDDAKLKYLIGIIVLAILLIILFAIIGYLTYQNRCPKLSKANPETKSENRNDLKDVYENPHKIEDDGNYEQVENERSMYTGLKKIEEDENDDYSYTHLTKDPSDVVNQKETGI